MNGLIVAVTTKQELVEPDSYFYLAAYSVDNRFTVDSISLTVVNSFSYSIQSIFFVRADDFDCIVYSRIFKHVMQITSAQRVYITVDFFNPIIKRIPGNPLIIDSVKELVFILEQQQCIYIRNKSRLYKFWYPIKVITVIVGQNEFGVIVTVIIHIFYDTIRMFFGTAIIYR